MKAPPGVESAAVDLATGTVTIQPARAEGSESDVRIKRPLVGES